MARICSRNTLPAACLLAVHAAFAQEFPGIALDQPLRVDECAQRLGKYVADDGEICLGRSGKSGSNVPANGTVAVKLTSSQRPEFMTGSDAVIVLLSGRVVSISVKTAGALRDGNDLAALERRFGKSNPRYTATSLQGRGASYESTSADWNLPDGGSVYFNSAEFGVNDAFWRIQTRAAPPHQAGT
jgi:hypothetical protein